jgi:hypothetical protein
VLTSENSTIKHSIAGHLHKANISWQLVSLLDNNHFARNKIQRRNASLCAVSNDKTLIGKHGADGSHDTTGRPVLPCIEGSLDDPNSNQDTGQRQVGLGRRVTKRSPRDKDQNTSTKEDTAETTEEISHDLTEKPGWRGRHDVLAMLGHATLDLVLRKTLVCVDRQAAAQFIDIEGMPIGDG